MVPEGLGIPSGGSETSVPLRERERGGGKKPSKEDALKYGPLFPELFELEAQTLVLAQVAS